MDERKNFVFIILAGLAVLFFLFTRFCLPLSKENAQLAVEFRQLKTETGAMGAFGRDELNSSEEKIDTAIADLEKKFPPEGKLKLVEQLTRLPMGVPIVFAEIIQGDPWGTEEYQVLPVEVNLKASFGDLLRYLAAIETSPLMIGIHSLSLRRLESHATSLLEVKIIFSGFRITHEFSPISKYLETKYEFFNKQRLAKLLEPVEPSGAEGFVSKLAGYDPFVASGGFNEEGLLGKEQVLPKNGGLSLEGIVRIGDEEAALINGHLVKKGETIEGTQVMRIERYKVVLMRSGKEYILKMGVDDGLFKP